MEYYKKIVQIIPNNNLKLMEVRECRNEDGQAGEMHLPVLCFALVEWEAEPYGLQQEVVPMVAFGDIPVLEMCELTNGFLRTEIVSDDCEV